MWIGGCVCCVWAESMPIYGVWQLCHPGHHCSGVVPPWGGFFFFGPPDCVGYGESLSLYVQGPLVNEIATRGVLLFGWRVVWKRRAPSRETVCREFNPRLFLIWIFSEGNRIIPPRCFGDFSPEYVPVGNARRGNQRPEISEGVDRILRKCEPYRGVGPDKFCVLKEVGATVWGSA